MNLGMSGECEVLIVVWFSVKWQSKSEGRITEVLKVFLSAHII